MNKTELVRAVASASNLTVQDAQRAVDALTDAITESLTRGDSVQLTGFGVFSVSERGERTGRNPQTGESIRIAAKKTPSFKAGAPLKRSVAGD